MYFCAVCSQQVVKVVKCLLVTWGSAHRWSPAYTASRTDRHTQCSSFGYSCHHWSSWCRHHSEGTLWSPPHLQQQSQCVSGDHTFCNIRLAPGEINWKGNLRVFGFQVKKRQKVPQSRKSHLLPVLHWRHTAWRHRCLPWHGGLAGAEPGHTSGWGATAGDSGSRIPCRSPRGRSSAWGTRHSRKLSLHNWGDRETTSEKQNGGWLQRLGLNLTFSFFMTALAGTSAWTAAVNVWHRQSVLPGEKC